MPSPSDISPIFVILSGYLSALGLNVGQDLCLMSQSKYEKMRQTKLVHPVVFAVQKRGGHQDDRRRDQEGKACR